MAECNAGTGGVALEQMAENIKLGRDPYAKSARPTKERFRELAIEIAAANGVMHANIYRGRPYAEVENDYQDAVRAFDEALDLIWYKGIDT